MPDDTQPGPYADVAKVFAAHRAQQVRQIAQAQAWEPPVAADDMELGTFESVTPLDGDQIGPVYARLAALSMDRLRVLSAQLAEQYREHGMRAFVRDRLIYNPATQEVETAGEEPTALARQDFDERKLLQNLLTTAVRLKLETHAAQARDHHARRMAALAQALCEQVGLDWADPETHRIAQQAVIAAETVVSGRA